MKLFEDKNGKLSPKRIIGFITGLIWLLLGIYVIIFKDDISINQVNVLNNFGYIGGALLGITVFENKIIKK